MPSSSKSREPFLDRSKPKNISNIADKPVYHHPFTPENTQAIQGEVMAVYTDPKSETSAFTAVNGLYLSSLPASALGSFGFPSDNKDSFHIIPRNDMNWPDGFLRLPPLLTQTENPLASLQEHIRDLNQHSGAGTQC